MVVYVNILAHFFIFVKYNLYTCKKARLMLEYICIKICVKIVKQEDEEVLRKMWEYLTQNYCSEVLIE